MNTPWLTKTVRMSLLGGGALSLMLTTGCASQEPAAPPQNPTTRPSGPAAPSSAAPSPASPAPGPRGEERGDRAANGASWTSAWAVKVPPSTTCEEADEDGDGFIEARRCPMGAVERLDCDDTDPAVTPQTERWVPPGPFLMGSVAAEAGSDEGPVHVVHLSGFCLDRVEATGAEVSAVVEDFRSQAGPELPAYPLSHAQAEAYCRAGGKGLPTEAQWEKAARGGCELGKDPAVCDPGDLRTYTWGEASPTCDRANHAQVSPTGPRPCAGTPVAAEATPGGAGPYGHLQLAGNVWEPVSDIWHPSTYGAGEPRTEPAGPSGEGARGIRGGGYDTFSTNMRVANRMSTLVAGSTIGVRCARAFAEARYDEVTPLEMVRMTGVVRGSEQVPLSGRALYVTAFAVGDAQGGQVRPGASPLSELRMTPNGSESQDFALEVPATGPVLLFASLDAGSPKPGVPASGSGGVGRLESPVETSGDAEGLSIVLKPLPGVVPMPRVEDPRRRGKGAPPAGGGKER